jgi:putative transposase
MARLPRLVVPGHAHIVVQRGHGDRPVFVDDGDRAAYLAALRESAPASGVHLLAWALLGDQVLLLARPDGATGISRLLQSVGRRYVSAYNRRHGRAGTLWDGRFRCAPVESGPTLLDLLAWVDGLATDPAHTSAGLRLAGRPDALLAHPAEFWALGNTPFEREAAYRRRLAEGPSAAQARHWLQAALGGWAIGSPAFAAGLAASTSRPVRPRAPGRPRKPGGPGGGTPRA